MKQQKFFPLLIFLFLTIVALIPPILTYREEFTDIFVHSPIAVAEMSSQDGRLIVNPFPKAKVFWQYNANFISIRTAVISLLIQLSNILGIPIYKLTFVPIIGFLNLILSFSLARLLIKNNLYALLYAIFISYHFITLNNIFYISMGIFFHMLFVFIFIKQLEKSNVIYIALLCLIFMCSFFTYYSGEFYNLLFLFYASLVIIVTKKSKLIQDKKPLLYLSIAFIVIFLSFDSVFYKYLTSFELGELANQISSYAQYVLNFVGGEKSYSQYRPMFSSKYASYFDALKRVTIVISILLYIVYHLFKFKKERVVVFGLRDIFFITVLVMCVSETIIYAMVGHLGWRYFHLFISLCALFSLSIFGRYFNKRVLSHFIAFVIVFSCVGNFVFSWNDPVNMSRGGRGYHLSMNQTAMWICQNIEKGKLVSDFNVSGRLLSDLARFNKADSVETERIYKNLDILYNENEEEFSNVFKNRKWDYMVVSKLYSDHAVYGDTWGPVGPPLGTKLLFLDTYDVLNKLYNDGNGYVYLYNNTRRS